MRSIFEADSRRLGYPRGVILPPPGWTARREENGLVFAPPRGSPPGAVHYAERLRPLRRVRELVDLAGFPAGYVPVEITKPMRLTTDEGEHAAVVLTRGALDGSSAEVNFAFVFLDDFYSRFMTVALGGTLMPLLEQLVLHDSHLLGHARRRRFVYTPPRGWQGVGDLFDTRFYPLDYPANPSRILVGAAVPAAPDLKGRLLAAMVGGIAKLADAELGPVTAVTTACGLEGQHYQLCARDHLHMHVVCLEDQTHLYLVRLDTREHDADANLDILRRLLATIEPIPRPRLSDHTPLAFWTD